MFYRKWKSPVGNLHLVADDTGLRALAFDANWERVRASLGGELREKNHPVSAQAILELSEYFAGTRKTFTVALSPTGSAFQTRAWEALRSIPYSETCTYLMQARKMNQPKAARAVGRANGMNPISIIVPCHRVVGANGSLTGYAGGLAAKHALLELERSCINRSYEKPPR